MEQERIRLMALMAVWPLVRLDGCGNNPLRMPGEVHSGTSGQLANFEKQPHTKYRFKPQIAALEPIIHNRIFRLRQHSMKEKVHAEKQNKGFDG